MTTLEEEGGWQYSSIVEGVLSIDNMMLEAEEEEKEGS